MERHRDVAGKLRVVEHEVAVRAQRPAAAVLVQVREDERRHGLPVYAALARFRERGSGVLINNASVNARIPGPYVSAYVATKWAVRGWSASLRQELRTEPDVHVCVVLPASIDTPFFQHAANRTGRAAKALRPVNDPYAVAAAIAALAERPRRERLVGRGAGTLSLQYALAPGLAERAFARQVERDHFADEGSPPTDGNLLAPVPDGAGVHGGWREREQGGLRRAALAGAVAAPALAAGLWLRARG
jgi:hypothetical protein